MHLSICLHALLNWNLYAQTGFYAIARIIFVNHGNCSCKTCTYIFTLIAVYSYKRLTCLSENDY